jgi:putative hydrolase of the HAD superfamily
MKTLLIDLDNTMVTCNIYYKFAKDNFIKIARKVTGKSLLEIATVLEKQEKNRLNSKDAFAKETFSNVFLQTISELINVEMPFSDKIYLKYELDAIEALAESVFTKAPYTIFPNVENTLFELKNRGYQMHIITKGHFYTQLRKTKQLPDVFSGIFIVPHKNAHVYEGVLEATEADLANTWMIGDSVQDDIIEARKAFLKTVWVKRSSKITWIGDPFIETFESDYTINTFSDLLNIFK